LSYVSLSAIQAGSTRTKEDREEKGKRIIKQEDTEEQLWFFEIIIPSIIGSEIITMFPSGKAGFFLMKR